MTATVSYKYAAPSALLQGREGGELFLSEYSETRKKQAECFFWGKLTQPFIVSRCLLALAKVVQSSYSLSAAQWAAIKDPIVTSGNQKLRFEGFSKCAGVYGRVDILPEGHDGEFIENGTTNVDFNAPMLASLTNVRRDEPLVLSVGPKEVGVYHSGESVVERKVPLPDKWIKGLTTVQIYQADAVCVHRFNRLQLLQLFRSVPKGEVKTDYYLVMRGTQPVFTPAKSAHAVCIGGLHRLRLLEPLLPYADELHVFAHPSMQTTVWHLYFKGVRFCLALSRESFRGFSGEGAALDALLEDVPQAWIEAMDNYSYVNQQFNAQLFAIEQGIDKHLADKLAVQLAAMGLLGFDLDENTFFYRRLPFKLERILKLNPRMDNANKLLTENRVEIVSQTPQRVEARVEGSHGVRHTVILDHQHQRCTCQWSRTNETERGACKHILAVKKLTKWKE